MTIDIYISMGRLFFTESEIWILNKFFNEWVNNSIILLWTLREPWFTWKTQSWIWVFEKVNHIMKCQILFLFTSFLLFKVYFGLEWSIIRIRHSRVFPKYSKFLNCIFLLLACLFVLQVFYYNITEYLWHQRFIKRHKVLNDLVDVLFLVNDWPQILNDLFAMWLSYLVIL